MLKLINQSGVFTKTINMFSLMKKRNEAARQKKMDHIFQKADENGNGKITPQQMVKAYAANDVTGNFQEQKNFDHSLDKN